mmetsp:Transcript_9839/g.29909  ORF Transcript_9839/g.29909 Transcript_9839/m.29909 type:complete len:259 (-) Transcript_9839:615-1391(-)
MFGIRPLRKAIGPSFWSMDLTHSPMPMEETVTRDLTVSMGWVSAVPHIEATLPPSILCQALISISSELLMIVSLILSNTKNSTALVGAILATLREFPLKSPLGPSVLAILASVPTKPSCLAFKEFTMYSIFTRSSGATTDRETPPETAPASRCFATDLPVLFTVSPFIFMYRPLDIGIETSTSPRSTTALPQTSNMSLMSLALVSSMKSLNSAKSMAFPAMRNSSFDSPRSPPPLENGPLPVLILFSMLRTSRLEMSL